MNQAITRFEQSLARSIGGVLCGLDRFTQKVLGMEGREVLRAWQSQIVQSIAEQGLDQAEPGQAEVREVEEKAWACWRKLTVS